ncbi:MAG: hypothetical protein KAG94_00385 [Clostridiales bacterium]|nr:hypothetical protein [Clostridiales bacterium]
MEKERKKKDKFQTAIWFVLGVVLVIIGGVILIPLLKIYGILWTILAVGVATYQGIKLFSSKSFTMWETINDED